MSFPTLIVEVSFTTGALDTPVWVDISGDVRSWDVSRGRSRELERFQPGRATVVLSNLSRQYDSQHATGPWFGNLRPMRRVRIRETWDSVTYPVYDGFVDKWVLDYPGVGHDATATIIATDLFKVLQRTDLPKSVYVHEVDTDAPLLWWRLGEPYATAIEERQALNRGTKGSAGDGTYVGAINTGSDAMIVNDPTTSLALANPAIIPATPRSGVDVPGADLNALGRMNDGQPFALEFWCRPDNEGGNFNLFWQDVDSATLSLAWDNADLQAGRFTFFTLDDFAGGQVLRTPDGSNPPGFIYHVVFTSVPQGSDALVTIYVNGAQAAQAVFADVFTVGAMVVTAIGTGTSATANWNGQIQDVAMYLPASGDPLSAARILVHYEAGTHPWQDDLPGVRAERVLDIVGVPETQQDLDAGLTPLQSATIGRPALDHLQKVAETEFGLLFVTRDGKVRLIDRSTLFGRTPDAAVFGDGGGEIGYRGFVPDDGDEEIRNHSRISRLDGAVRTATDTGSLDEFGRFDYTAEGLYHRTEDYSQDYANLIVNEYGEPGRRVKSLDLGPPVVGEEATVYPAMLSRELGDAITVRSRPVGGGDLFEAVCAVEGIEHAGAPGGVRTTRLVLSPEFPARDWEDSVEIGYAEVTAEQTGITTLADLTNLTVDVTVAANRRIRITGLVGQFARTAGTVTFVNLFVREGGTTLGGRTQVLPNTYNGAIVETVLTPSAGAHTYKLSAQSDGTVRLTGSSTLKAFILVEDIGPA